MKEKKIDTPTWGPKQSCEIKICCFKDKEIYFFTVKSKRELDKPRTQTFSQTFTCITAE